MKNLLMYLIVLISTQPVIAQTVPEEKIGYLDKNHVPVNDPKTAVYYRTLQTASDGYIVRDYYMSGRIEMMAICSEYTPDIVRDGEAKYYHENGNLREQGVYKKDMRNGEFAYYFETGKPERRIIYDGPTEHILEYYSPTGRQLVSDGTGMLTDTNDAGDTIYSEVTNYKIVACYQLNPDGSKNPLIVERIATHPGGMQAMMEFLQQNVEYPKAARRRGAEGRVFVSFVVDKTGAITDISIMKGIDPDCDAESIRVVSKLPNWEPAIQRGKTVRSRYVLPIKFGLAPRKR